MTHICFSKTTITGSDNGLSPGRRQAIIWTNVGILLIGTLGTNFSEILSEIHTFSFMKMHFKMSSILSRPQCVNQTASIRLSNKKVFMGVLQTPIIKLWKFISIIRESFFYNDFMVLIFMGAIWIRNVATTAWKSVWKKIGCTDPERPLYLTACIISNKTITCEIIDQHWLAWSSDCISSLQGNYHITADNSHVYILKYSSTNGQQMVTVCCSRWLTCWGRDQVAVLVVNYGISNTTVLEIP